MKFNLENKKVLITGASGGIGKAISEKFILCGSKLIFTSSNNDNLKCLKNNYGSDHLYYFMDLSDIKNLNLIIQEIADENKDLDILINNAGITKDNLFLRMNSDQWNDVIDVNLNSNFHIIKAILPQMIKRKFGKII